MGSPSRSASGVAVSCARNNGLATMRVTGSLASKFAAARACRQPSASSGGSLGASTSPSLGRPWRTRIRRIGSSLDHGAAGIERGDLLGSQPPICKSLAAVLAGARRCAVQRRGRSVESRRGARMPQPIEG